MNKIKRKLRRGISLVLAVVMIVTSGLFSGETVDTFAAAAYYPTLSFNLGKLSTPNGYVGKLTSNGTDGEMCSIHMAGRPVFCMQLNASLSRQNAFYGADINKYGKSYLRYFRGAIYYYENENKEFTLNATVRYVVTQIMLWRILQIRAGGKFGTYANIMNGFENTFKSIVSYWGETDADIAWKEIKTVMQWVNNGVEKVSDKYVTLYLWTHQDGTQPLLAGEVEAPSEEKAYIAIQKKGKVENANVKDAKFGIYAKKGCNDASYICTLTTDMDGYAITTKAQAEKLKPSTTYYIKEIQAPAGSKINDTVYKIKTGDKITKKQAVKLTVADEQYRIRINTVKADLFNTSKKLSGATFRVCQWNTDSRKYEFYKDYVTGVNGDFTTEWLYYTKTNAGKYRVEEIKAPGGYKLSGFKKDIQIDEGNTNITVRYTASNPPYPGWIEIHKAAFVGDKNVSGEMDLSATFTIYSNAECTKIVGEIQTDKKGIGKSKDLNPGTYYVRETKWGKVRPAFKDAQSVSVKAQETTMIYGKAGRFAGQIPDVIGIKLRKVDADNHNLAVEGAEFSVYEYNGVSWALIEKGISDEKGLVEIKAEDNKLYYTEKNQGRFKIVETAAPEGYVLDPTPRYVTITDENAGTTVDLGQFENISKNGALEIQKIIVDLEGNQITDIPVNDSVLNITYGLYTDETFKNPVNDSIKLDREGYAKLEELPAGIYYLKETKCNGDIFAGTASLNTRYIEITINRGKTTYVDGERGYSENGSVWYDCWNNANNVSGVKQILENSLLSVLNNIRTRIKADSNIGVIMPADSNMGVAESTGSGMLQYQTVSLDETKAQKTICDIKDIWKECTDEEIDRIIGNSEEAALAEFLINLSDDELELILNKNTRLTQPYTTYQVADEDTGEIQEVSKAVYWEYLMSLPYRPSTMSILTRKKGYFYITITGDGKTTSMTVNVTADAFHTESSMGITISTNGTNNHNFRVSNTSVSTQLSASGTEYNIIQMKFSYTKPAHYVSSGSSENYATTSGGNAMACHFNGTLNNKGHNAMAVTETLQTSVNIINAGLLDYGGKTYHATLSVQLSQQYGGVRVNPNGGSWKNGSTIFTSDTGPYWAYVCGRTMSIANPTRTGHTFTGWSVTNGVNAHGSLSGNVHGDTITSSNSTLVCGGKAASVSQGVTSGYYTTLTANWKVNTYAVTCIDVAGSNAAGKELGRSTFIADYGTTASGSYIGTDKSQGAYHADYYYTGSTYATVTTSGATVYRYFSKSPEMVVAPNILKNVLKMVELNIIKTDVEDEIKTLEASFNILEWSQTQNMYVPYLMDVKTQERVLLRLTFDNLGKYHMVETKVQSDYVMSRAEADISIYDDAAKSVPSYSNTLGIDADMGVFVNGRGYNRGDIVRDGADISSAVWYRCLVSNVGKSLTDAIYWQRVTESNYGRYADLINGAGTWDESLDSCTVMTVQVKNIKKASPGYAALSINKKNDTGNILEGAKFAAYYKDDGSLCGNFANNKSLTVLERINISDTQTHSIYDEISGVRTLKLVIKEETAPFGYKKIEDINVTIKSKLHIDTNEWEAISIIATFSDGTTQDISSGIAITVTDPDVKLNISITKQSTERSLPVETLRGAIYGIYDNAECTSLVTDVIINAEGKAEAAGLTLKDYWLRELSSPESGIYKLSDEVRHIDASTLYDGSESVSVISTSVMVTDEPYTGEILIKKHGYIDSTLTRTKTIKDAGFTLYALPQISEGRDEDEYVMSYDFFEEEPVRKEQKTDSDGIVRFMDVPLGDYVIVETTVPEGYVKTENRVVHLTKAYAGNNDDTAYPVVMYDEPYAAPIRIYKKSSVSENYLEGAVFQIFDVNAGGYIAETAYGLDADGKEIKSLEPKLYATDENGLITTQKLTEGIYRIEEVSAPKGYVLNKTPMEVVIKEGNEAGYDKDGYPYFEVTMKNVPTDAYFTKMDMTTKKEIEGGYYSVCDSDGKVINEWEGTGEPHHIYGLETGEEYVFTEKTAPDGYVVAESITFTIKEDGSPTAVVMEDDYNKVEISKQDITTKEELPGARLQILDEEGKVVEEWTSGVNPHRINRISVGTYILKEIQAPDGYVISEEIEFEVGESTKVQKVVMYDEYTKTAFVKLAEDTLEPLKGCVLQIKDETGSIIDEWTTDGEIHYTYRLTSGKTYFLCEASAPEGYELAEDICFVAGKEYISAEEKVFQEEITDTEGIGIDDDSHIEKKKDTLVPMEEERTVDENADPDDGLDYAKTETDDVLGEDEKDTFKASEPVIITMTDSPLEIVPEKVDENGNPIYGAILQILDESGKVLYEWESSIMQSKGFQVASGTYTLREVEAPKGYQKFKDTKVTVSDKDVAVKLVDHTMEATITKGNDIVIRKVNPLGAGLEGAVLQIVDKEGKVVKEFTSESGGTNIRGIPKGEYVLHEVLAPKGYETADDVKFTIADKKVTVTMTDEFKKLKLPFTGGVLFHIFTFVIPLILLGAASLELYKKKRWKVK